MGRYLFYIPYQTILFFTMIIPKNLLIKVMRRKSRRSNAYS